MNGLISRKEETLEIILKNLYAQGYLTKQRLWQLSYELDLIIQKKVLDFNHGNSTSISFDNYTWIIETIDYVFLHGYGAYGNEENLLQTTALKDVLYTGVKVIQREIVEIKDLFEKIKKQAVYFPNDFMRYLIKKEIPSILNTWNSYNSELYYSRIIEDLSYPLLDGLPVLHQMYDLKGSNLVYYYLKRVHMEISFCMLFKKEYQEFAKRFKEIKDVDLSDLLINLSEICMNQAIASFILYKNTSLLLTQEQVLYVKQKLKQVSSMQSMIHTVMNSILNSVNNEVKEYFMMFEDIWVKNFYNFVFYDVELLIYKRKQEIHTHTFYLSRNTDFCFEKIMKQLQETIQTQDKVEVLRNSSLEVYDLIDLFENGIFFGEEYFLYFQTLDNLSLSILLKYIIQDRGYENLDDEIQDDMKEDCGWMKYLKLYIQSLPQKQYQEIKNNINYIKLI